MWVYKCVSVYPWLLLSLKLNVTSGFGSNWQDEEYVHKQVDETKYVWLYCVFIVLLFNFLHF